MKDEIFKHEIGKLCVFFDKPLNEGQLDIWYELLKYIPDKAFQSAINYIVRSNRFFPTPEDFLIYYREFEPRTWEEVKAEKFKDDEFTQKQLKSNRVKRDEIIEPVMEKKDINRIIGDKK